MPNWWENNNFLQGNWGNIESGAQSYYDPAKSRMEYLNPSGSEYFMPFTPGAMTGAGLTPNPTPGAGIGGATGMDPYYGYGYLFGAPNGPLTPSGTANSVGNLSPVQGQIGGGDVMPPTPFGQANPLTMINPGQPWMNPATGQPWMNPATGQPWMQPGGGTYLPPPQTFGQPGVSPGGQQLSAVGGPANQQNRAPQQGPTWNPNTGPAGGPLGPPTKQGNVVYSPVGDQEKLLDLLFRGSVTGQGGGPIAKMLYNLGLGQLPPALAEQIVGKTNEQFGHMGARFGTDLGTAQARGLAQASEAQSLDAIRQILGLGGTTAGFQFQRGESALERAMKEFIAQQQMDPMNQILQTLLGGG